MIDEVLILIPISYKPRDIIDKHFLGGKIKKDAGTIL
jgi:hypothetical protein